MTAGPTPTFTSAASYGTNLSSPNVRYLLGVDMPEIPEELLQADTYLLSIITAALLDGRQEGTDGIGEPA